MKRMESGGEHRPALLLVDGHKSRHNSQVLLDALCNNVIILCLPSHLTHLLQPNDAGFNRSFKSKLSQLYGQLLANEVPCNQIETARMCIQSLNRITSRQIIINSFKHCGIWPFDSSKQLSMVLSEQPTALAHDERAIEVVEMVKTHIIDINQHQNEAAQRKASTPSRTKGLSTSYAVIMSSLDSITLVKLDDWKKDIDKLKTV